MTKRLFLLLPVLLIGSFLLAACGASGQQNSKVKLAPVSALPKPMQDAPATVRTAYQFAVANPDALQNVPCYCGCGAIGHKSNLACYIKEVGAGRQAGVRRPRHGLQHLRGHRHRCDADDRRG